MVTEVQKYKALYEEQLAMNAILANQIALLQNQLAWLKRQMFGQKSERFVDEPSKEELLPGLDLLQETKEIQTTQIVAHTRNSVKNKESFKIDIPEDLPRERVYKDIPEEKKVDPKTGNPLVKIGEEIVEKLAYKPGSYIVKQVIYPKYASKANPLLGVRQAASEDSIIEGSRFDVTFMAHIITEKFAYHMPINRIREKLTSANISISDQTLCGLLINIGQKLEPLVTEMKKELFKQKVLFTDDTPIDMIVNGLGKTKQGRMWGYIGNKPGAPPYHLYEFSSSRSEIWPLSYLKEFKGIMHADAYSAYEKLDGYEGISWAACWAHARRKFENSTSMHGRRVQGISPYSDEKPIPL